MKDRHELSCHSGRRVDCMLFCLGDGEGGSTWYYQVKWQLYLSIFHLRLFDQPYYYISKYILLKCLISLIRGERSKLLVRLLWTCQEIIVHAKQNKFQYIIHNKRITPERHNSNECKCNESK